MRLIIFPVLVSVAFVVTPAKAATMNAYKKVDIHSRQVYKLDDFPFKQYFVCIRKNQGDDGVADYLQNDLQFKQALRKTAGETAALLYRYLKELPEKENITAAPIKNGSFYTKEQVPFINDTKYSYAWPYLTPAKADYQYAMRTTGMFKEKFDFKTEKGRHWVVVEPTFYRRQSDYQVMEDKRFSGLFILLSVNSKSVQAADSERSAYQQAWTNAKAYFFQAKEEDCKVKAG